MKINLLKLNYTYFWGCISVSPQRHFTCRRRLVALVASRRPGWSSRMRATKNSSCCPCAAWPSRPQRSCVFCEPWILWLLCETTPSVCFFHVMYVLIFKVIWNLLIDDRKKATKTPAPAASAAPANQCQLQQNNAVQNDDQRNVAPTKLIKSRCYDAKSRSKFMFYSTRCFEIIRVIVALARQSTLIARLTNSWRWSSCGTF